MKTMIKQVAVFSCILAGLLCAGNLKAEDEEVNVQGIYVEGGGTFFAPLGGGQVKAFDIGIARGDVDKVGLGGGGHIALGYDTKWIGVGTKLRAEMFNAGSATGGRNALLLQWDLIEAKLYVLDWFREKPGKLRPYILLGGGVNQNPFTFWGGQVSLGGGVQYQITRHFYLGLETSYRHLFLSEQAPAISAAATVGFRF